ncbi:phage virion morphogenesis protein [Salmonella enterica]|uniref:phage virion morphogenesis protein n=1 Tax=Salmonella enterica TaxID=28901 RepID=UPI0009ADDD82|nr:phage virion morphogenesis protein [Salmonella enterica]EBR7949553.1 phage virion morphogenesis protein [Salmonella enterica subsp. enterica serovar Stanley]ECC3218404.1 phage virion morphogenesis protein [Salmonella enterica subsp. enterica]ECN1289713.1 phage virion morphogenesis protein [Salmonella enterica subsp. enterica serovar Agona]ECS6810173.1 phage virion morphogenesis protein [Salmonella enterica subsp. enterica serovar Newport]EDA3200387.1 phage virion morphogenesis protein [Salm
MSELTSLQERLAGLIASLSPAARRQMAADIAKKLRASQQQRIRRQQAPDGTPYAARKRQPVRSKKGRIRREMFARLRTNRFMKAKGSDSAVVEFTGRVQRMARVHQYGLKDRPNRHSRDVQYAARPLLGFTRDDEQMIEDIIIRHLGK